MGQSLANGVFWRSLLRNVWFCYQSVKHVSVRYFKWPFFPLCEIAKLWCFPAESPGDLARSPEMDKLKSVTKCYAYIETSSNPADIYRMTNGETSSYWQSDGSARSHWIRWGVHVLVFQNLEWGLRRWLFQVVQIEIFTLFPLSSPINERHTQFF